MAMTEIKASKEIEGVLKESSILFDYGESLAEAQARFGDEVVFSNFKRSANITAQAAMRRLMEAGKSQEEIVTAMAAWKPGVSLDRQVDPVKALMGKFATLTPEEQTKIIEDLMAKQAK